MRKVKPLLKKKKHDKIVKDFDTQKAKKKYNRVGRKECTYP